MAIKINESSMYDRNGYDIGTKTTEEIIEGNYDYAIDELKLTFAEDYFWVHKKPVDEVTEDDLLYYFGGQEFSPEDFGCYAWDECKTYTADEMAELLKSKRENKARKTEAKENEYGEKLYKVYVNTGTAWCDVREVYAYNESEAVDKVVDRLEEEGSNLVIDYYELNDMVEYPDTIDDLIVDYNLTCAGNHGLFVSIDRVELA